MKIFSFFYLLLCCLLLCLCGQIPDKQFKGGRIYFGSQFQRVQPMVTLPHVLVQNIMEVGTPYSGQEGARDNILARTNLQMTCFIPEDSHLLKFPPKIVPPVGDQVPDMWTFGGTLHIQTIAFYLWPLKGSCPSHNENCIQLISMNSHVLNCSNFVQKSNFKVPFESQCNLLAVSIKPKKS
jgi:hypothetical protein